MEIPIGFGVEQSHPREWFIRLDKNLDGLKYAGLAWFEKLKEIMEARYFVQSQVDPCVWYKEEIGLLFYVYDCLLFSPSKDKIDEVYASLQSNFNIEDDGELNKYIGIELDRRPYGSINIRQPYLTQRILNMIQQMDKSSAKPTPAVKPPPVKK